MAPRAGSGQADDPGGGSLSLSLLACPSCGFEIGSPGQRAARGGARAGDDPGVILVCPRCGASLAAVAAVAAAAEEQPAPDGGGIARAGAVAPALGSHAAKGFSFMLLQSFGTRVVAFACQLALSYILMPDAWGTVALADTILNFANLLQLIGVREIIVSRQRKFHVWSNSAFWITTTTGWLTAALIAISAPIAAHLRGTPELAGVLFILALAIPLYSMGIVAEAKLQAELRFKRLALIIAVWAMLLPILTVVFALLGFGVYSFVLPRLVAGAVRLAMVMHAARPRVRRRPQFRRWRYLVGASLLVITTSLLLMIAQCGDRFLLGVFAGDHELGLYAFAFAFSFQTILMVSINLQGVLFATLAKLNDEPKRQLAAFLRASRVLAMIVTPICVFQSVASEPVVRTLFAYDKWKDAIPAMQLLGLGMVFLGAYCPATAMLEAQRRFSTKFWLALAHALLFILAVTGLAWLGYRGILPFGTPGAPAVSAITGGACGVALTTAIISPVWSYVTTRRMGGGWADTLAIVSRPLIAAGIAAGVGTLAGTLGGRMTSGHTLAGIPIEHWTRLLVFGTVACGTYIALARFLMPAEFREVARKAAAVARRASPRAAVAVERAAGIA